MHGVTSHVVKYVLDSQNISIEDKLAELQNKFKK